METVAKITGAGIVFFSVVLAGFVGSRVDQTTLALLGGTFIGLLVAVPTTLLVILISQRRRDEQAQQPPAAPPAPTAPTQPTQVIERRVAIVVVPSGLQRWQQLDAVVGAFPGKISRHTAEQLLLTGAVKVVER